MYFTVLGDHNENLQPIHVNKHEEKVAKRELRNKTRDRPQSRHAHRDRRVGQRVLWGRADHWRNSPGRAGTRTATSRKLTDTSRKKKRKAVQTKDQDGRKGLESKYEMLLNAEEKYKSFAGHTRSNEETTCGTHLKIVTNFMSPCSCFA